MIIGFLKRKFRVRRTNKLGEPISHVWIEGATDSALVDPDSGKLYRVTANAPRPPDPFWIGNSEEMALIDAEACRVLAYINHDGHRKYYPTVYVSILRAIQLIRSHHGFLVSLRSLPRCAVDLVRLRSMDGALEAVEYFLGGGS